MIEPGTFLEYSGRSLALIEWANWLKLTFFLSLLVSLAWPWGMATRLTVSALVVALLIYLVKIIGLTFLLAVWELARVKLRLRRAFSPLLAALGFALIAVVYTVAANYLL